MGDQEHNNTTRGSKLRDEHDTMPDLPGSLDRREPDDQRGVSTSKPPPSPKTSIEEPTMAKDIPVENTDQVKTKQDGSPTPTIGGIALTDLVVTPDNLNGETISVVPIYKVRKPKRHEFIRVHPDNPDGTNDYEIAMLLYISDEEMEKVHYLVTPGLIDYFNGAVRTCSVRLAMSRVGGKPEGAPFILVTSIPEEGSGGNSWIVSMQAAAEEAKVGWIKACSNKDTGAYDLVKPVDPNAMPEPKWPTTPFPEILEKVFEGRIVSDPDHEVIRKLTGAM